MNYLIALILVAAPAFATPVSKEVSKKALETLILNAGRVQLTGDVASDENIGTLIHGYIFPDGQGARPKISNDCGIGPSGKILICNLAAESRLSEQFLKYSVDVETTGADVRVLGMSNFKVEVVRGGP